MLFMRSITLCYTTRFLLMATVFGLASLVTPVVASTFTPPVAVDDYYGTNQDTTLAVAAPGVLNNDFGLENNALMAEVVHGPAHGALTFAPDGSFTYLPAQSYAGEDSFTYTAYDDHAASAVRTVTILVNRSPLAVDDTTTVLKNSRSNPPIDVLANDNDDYRGDTSITAISQPRHGSSVLNDGLVLYTPAPDYYGIDQFTYTINDGHGGTATATVTVQVKDESALVAQDDAFDVQSNTAENTIDVLQNDSCNEDIGGTLLLMGVTNAEHGAVSLENNRLRYTPEPDYSGPDSFSYTVSDGIDSYKTANVAVIVAREGNKPPVAGEDTVAVPRSSGEIIIPVLANDSDADGDALTVSAITAASHGKAALHNGQITYTPTPGSTAPDSFTYTVRDNVGGKATATVNITIDYTNEPPVPEDDLAEIPATGGSVNIFALFNDNDVDNDGMKVTSVTQGDHGRAVLNADSTITYTATTQPFEGDRFSYVVDDGHGGCATGWITIRVEKAK